MKRQRGYSLLEVIVAFALLALALTLLLGSLSGASRQVGQAELRSRAVLHAQSLLATTGVIEPLQQGERSGQWEEGRYHWRLQVEPYADARADAGAGALAAADTVAGPVLAQLTLQVWWGQADAQRLQWRSLRLLPANAGTLR
ncbi:type II secretion system protein XpsI [Stenotrophomonas rhizophila]|uniref:type II secretion system protein XpsI n=1 Tax=Stenotrophomonas rhizophila TaxID=216778 RepID=UPI001E4D8FDD|nr:prepilin-type N-terminal cleavage/methylation domain-containing protein [Stenotrophomonas rhizophila]MCC7634035.1 prepilin-type N-terminal cleavage/methylation domain-containing protein [Stenotrophomonas rhizophila]MCC7662731.1 prepilin-type N-terminal cleavage/methylation domain-containing protein [Stenotrophomonas rhizophila]